MPVDYDRAAGRYDRRYARGGPAGVRRALDKLMRSRKVRRVLEVGCGTGHWLATLNVRGGSRHGCDPSEGMLARARRRGDFPLARARGEELPYRRSSFDLVLCVHTLHHVADPESFIREAQRVLRPEGALVVIGMNPLAGSDSWYLYDYFPGTYERDLQRYPSAGTVTDWMIAAGFVHTECRQAARILDTRVGREVLQDPILERDGTSQLSLLSDVEYATGISQITAAIENAERDGATIVFPVDIGLMMVTGTLRK